MRKMVLALLTGALLSCIGTTALAAESGGSRGSDGSTAGTAQLKQITADIDTVHVLYDDEELTVRTIKTDETVYVSLDDLCIPLGCFVRDTAGEANPVRFGMLTRVADLLTRNRNAVTKVSPPVLSPTDQAGITIDPNPGVVTLEGIRAFLSPISYEGRLYAPAAYIAGVLDKKAAWKPDDDVLLVSDYEDKAIGSVNGDLITQRDIDFYLQPMLPSIQREAEKRGVSADELAAKERDTLYDNIVQDIIIHQEAIDHNVYLSQADYNAINSSLFDTVDEYQGISGYTEHLNSMGLSFGQVLETYRLKLRNRDLIQQLLQNVQVGEEEVKQYFNKNKDSYILPEKIRVNHILLSAYDDNGALKSADQLKALKAKADELLKQIRAGGDFYALMKANTDDQYYKRYPQGYVFTRDEIVKPFADAAFKLQPGGISDVVETQYGYHIIKLEQKIPAHPMTLDEARDSIRSILMGMKQEQTVNELLAKWKAERLIRKF